MTSPTPPVPSLPSSPGEGRPANEITVRTADIYAPVGAGGSIVLGAGDGTVDVSRLVSGLTLEADWRGMPVLTLRLTVAAKVRAGAARTRHP